MFCGLFSQTSEKIHNSTFRVKISVLNIIFFKWDGKVINNNTYFSKDLGKIPKSFKKKVVRFDFKSLLSASCPFSLAISKTLFWICDVITFFSISDLTVGWGTKAQCFCPPYLKTWFFYVLFDAELNGTIRILCFHHAIFDLLWPSRAQLGHSRSIMAQRKHKILMVTFNSALKTT